MAATDRSTARPGRRSTSSRARGRRRSRSTPSPPTVLGEIRKAKSEAQALDAHRGHRARSSRDTADAARARSSRRSTTCATPVGSSASSSLEAATSSRSTSSSPTRRRVTLDPRDAPAPGSTPTSTSRPASASPARGAGGASAPLAVERQRPLMDLLGSPAGRVPGGAPHRHQRQDLDRPHDRRPPGGGGPLGGRRHQPPPRSGSTSAWSWNGEPISDEDLDRICSSRWPTVEDLLPDAPELLRDPHRGRASTGSPTSRSTWRWSRWAWAGRWDATNVVDADVAVVTNVEHRPRGVPRPDAGRASRPRRPGSSSRRRRSCSARPIPSSCRSSSRATPARSCTRDVDFGVRVNRLAHRRPARRPVHAVRVVRRGVRPAARRAPGRQRGGRARGGRVASSATRSTTDVVPTRSRRCSRRVGSRSSVTTRSSLLDGAKNVAGAHALRAALDEEFADAPRTLVVGLLREKEPHEMLDALGVARRRRAWSCCRPDSPRARDPEEVADAACDARRRPRDRRRRSTTCATRSRTRSRSRPPTARWSSPARSTSPVPARSVLVD